MLPRECIPPSLGPHQAFAPFPNTTSVSGVTLTLSVLPISSQFQFNMTLFWSSTQDQVIGTCFFYQDEYCANIISSTTGIDMCKSDIDGSSYYTSFDTYLGSHMCI